MTIDTYILTVFVPNTYSFRYEYFELPKSFCVKSCIRLDEFLLVLKEKLEQFQGNKKSFKLLYSAFERAFRILYTN